MAMFSAALFMRAKNWGKAQMPINRRKNKYAWYVQTVD